MFNNTKIRSF